MRIIKNYNWSFLKCNSSVARGRKTPGAKLPTTSIAPFSPTVPTEQLRIPPQFSCFPMVRLIATQITFERQEIDFFPFSRVEENTIYKSNKL
jgi:hypothetical protein